MFERILIAGSGGQGLVLAGRLLATAALRQIPHITFFPSYGAEVRGGTSNCQVVLSSMEIASPTSEQFDSLVLMSSESVDRFLNMRHPRSLVLVNSSLCTPPSRENLVMVPATGLADEMGDARAANLIMMGVLLSRKPVVSAACMEAALHCVFAGKPAAVIERNLCAFRAGLQYNEA